MVALQRQRLAVERALVGRHRGLPRRGGRRARSGNMRYTEVRPAAYNAKAQLHDMDTDGIDLAVLYPTSMLGLQSLEDEEFARIVQARA